VATKGTADVPWGSAAGTWCLVDNWRKGGKAGKAVKCLHQSLVLQAGGAFLLQ
jgi:hypothetical protein